MNIEAMDFKSQSDKKSQSLNPSAIMSNQVVAENFGAVTGMWKWTQSWEDYIPVAEDNIATKGEYWE